MDLGEFLEQEVYPALFERLDAAFPDFGWQRKGNRWEATAEHTRTLAGSPRPDRVQAYDNTPFGFQIQGGDFVRWLNYVNGGTKPTGSDFIEMARRLSDLAGVPFPERQRTPAELAVAEHRYARQSVMDDALHLCQETLSSEQGTKARDYLKSRGLSAEVEDLGLGLYPADVSTLLQSKGHKPEQIRDALAGAKTKDGEEEARRRDGQVRMMAGYIVFPQRDGRGELRNLAGRYIGTPSDNNKKTLNLAGEGRRDVPLFLDRAKGETDLVLVEGLFDAAVPQSRGLRNVVAIGSAQIPAKQVETLKRHRVRSVTLCLDPDTAGTEGMISTLHALTKAGIRAYVSPDLPPGKDPDEFFLEVGEQGWRAHLKKARRGCLYLAEQILSRHNLNTDKGKDDAVEELEALDARLPEVDGVEVWKLAAELTGLDFHALFEASQARKDQEALRRVLMERTRALEAGEAPEKAVRTLSEALGQLKRQRRQAEPVRSVADELQDLEERLARWRGREYVGLIQKTIPALDKATLGLRRLMLLSAAPNVGKTALGVQLGVDVVRHNEDACFLFLSLEMPRWEILTRIKCHLARMDWKTLVLGPQQEGGGRRTTFTARQLEDLHQADEQLAEWGLRIQILDEANFPAPTVEDVLGQLEALKHDTGSSRALVLVDYLQQWPIPEEDSRAFRSNLDADKWQVGAMKQLRDGAEEGDGILVISEARKPSSGTSGVEWGGELADVMGSARGTYTPDMVFLFRPLSDEELVKEMSCDKVDAPEKRNQLAKDGKALNTFRIAKGRDGVTRDTIPLTFRFTQARFTQGHGDGEDT